MENIFLRKYISLNAYGFWAISFGDWTRNFNRVVRNAHYVLEEPFEERLLLWRKLFSKIFSGSEDNVFSPFLKKFSEIPGKRCPQKQFSLKTSCQSRVKAEFFSEYLEEMFWQDVQNRISDVQRSVFPQKNLLLKTKSFFSAIGSGATFFW